MKKLLTILLLGIFLISFSSAFEFDNCKKYNEEKKEVIIENSFCLGEEIARIKLNTPLNNLVGAGYQKVAELPINNKKDYQEALKGMKFYNKRIKSNKFDSENEIEKVFDYRVLEYKDIEVEDFYYDCHDSILTNGTIENNCNKIITGSHLESIETWNIINSKDLKEGNITLGIFTDVKVGESIEWIPTYFGVDIPEFASWTQSLNVGITYYYTLDGSLAVDSLNKLNLTKNGGITTGVSGILSSAFEFDGTTGFLSGINGAILNTTGYTVNMWIKNTGSDAGMGFLSDQNGGNYWGFSYGENCGAGNFGLYDEGANVCYATTFAPTNWYMITTTYDGTNVRIYIDGTNVGNTTGTINGAGLSPTFSKRNTLDDSYFDGIIDEIGIWGRNLNTSEITQLYNGGSGITYTDIFGATVEILYPLNTTYTDFITELNYTNSSDANKCWYTTNGGTTNSSAINCGTNFTGVSSTGGVNVWTLYVNNSLGTELSDTVTFFVNKTVETNLITPEEGSNFTNQVINFNFTSVPINSNLSNATIFIWNSTDDNLIRSNFTSLSGSIPVNTTLTNTLDEGVYVWNAQTCGVDVGCEFANSNNSFVVHTTSPTVNIIAPSGITDYFLLGDNETLIYNITELGQNLTEHIEDCWYNYNSQNYSLNCTENQTSFIYVNGINNITVYVNDSFGLTGSNISTWDYKVLEINQSYNNQTIEGNLETFLATIRLGTGYSIAGAVLINYNSSENIGQSFTSGDNTVLRKASFLVPNVEADTNVTFYWNITLSDSTNLALSSQNQTITKLSLDNCSAFTNQLLNMTVVDEEAQTILPNATIEVAVNIYDQSRTTLVLNFSDIYENINPLGICLNVNLTGTSMLSLDTIIRYEEDNHANEYYNIVNLSLTNETSTQELTLYDLSLNDSTDFQLSFTGSDFLPVENALVYVDRQYISENTFKTVELPKTDYNGQSVLHLVRNDVIYNIRITKDGVVLGNFENLVAFCDDFTIGDCNIELNAFDSVAGIFDYNADLGILFNAPEYNETLDLVSFNFVTSDGTAKEVTLEVTRNDIFGNRSVCNSSLISSGGTLSCSVDPNLDETTLNTNVYVNDILSVKASVDIDSSDYGEGGYLVAFVMIFSILLFFIESKEGILIAMGLSLASTIGFGLQSGNMVGLGASGIWLLVIIIIGIYKLNKDRQQ